MDRALCQLRSPEYFLKVLTYFVLKNKIFVKFRNRDLPRHRVFTLVWFFDLLLSFGQPAPIQILSHSVWRISIEKFLEPYLLTP
ncbi:hypothetical protein MGMO_176c00170 [Methyloglobulus morosus KoM1]|uniref:Uncharacterized protein n=1 Tax=Methyloglobulus morosus KoM1 TaxID=1116472 RepID=V5DHA2_9GAMM|nr:hypothetical protein MGMO_176c00170 [Methyloglobulus morosus KoM1]